MLSENRRLRNADTIGSTIKSARETAGFTQRALAVSIGLEYYTMISQMELGYISVPPALWLPLCDSLGIPRMPFVLQCLMSYQPEVYEALFGKHGMSDSAKCLDAFHKGQLDDILMQKDQPISLD